jgi:hypothetical protein
LASSTIEEKKGGEPKFGRSRISDGEQRVAWLVCYFWLPTGATHAMNSTKKGGKVSKNHSRHVFVECPFERIYVVGSAENQRRRGERGGGFQATSKVFFSSDLFGVCVCLIVLALLPSASFAA